MNQPPTPNSADLALEDRISRLYNAVKELQLAWNIEGEIEVSY